MGSRGGGILIDRKEIVMLFFDLPMESGEQRKAYRTFRKFIKGSGYVFLQKSVYIRLFRNGRNVAAEYERLKKEFPAEGSLCILPMGPVSFNKMMTFGKTTFDCSIFMDDVVLIQ